MHERPRAARMDAVGVMGAAMAMLVLAGLIAWSLAGGHPLGRFFGAEDAAAPSALDRAAVAPALVLPAAKRSAHTARPAFDGRGGGAGRPGPCAGDQARAGAAGGAGAAGAAEAAPEARARAGDRGRRGRLGERLGGAQARGGA